MEMYVTLKYVILMLISMSYLRYDTITQNNTFTLRLINKTFQPCVHP